MWFLAHLLESLRRVRPALAASLGQVLEEHGDDAGRYVLTTLIDEIHEKDDRIALVIDDWHRVSDPATTAALGFLLEHGCHHMQIIVTSWSRAGLPVSRLRIQDELVEIDCESMRFNDSEARSFLNDVGGLQLSGSDVDALTASTDGWAAALQLAALSLRGGGDANSLIGRLSGASDVAAMSAAIAGVVLGNILAMPVLAQTANVYQVGALHVPVWVDVMVPVAMCCLVAVAAVLPALRAGRLSAVQAIATGRAPRTGRGYAAHRLLGQAAAAPTGDYRPGSTIGPAGSHGDDDDGDRARRDGGHARRGTDVLAE